MALQDMRAELRGCVPKMPFAFTKTLINRAWDDIRKANLWSFQLFEGQWIAPPQVTTTGTVATTQGNATVTLDATANAAVLASQTAAPYSPITKRQFRIGSGGIYNIWGYDSGTGTLTLDRLYGEASQASATNYSIYQVYFIPQTGTGTYISDFRSWIGVRDMQNFIDLFVDRYNRSQLDAVDPQRTWYYFPTDVVPYQNDQNPSSATYGYFMFELWGGGAQTLNYQLLGIRKGLDLVLPTDTLPFAVGEDAVMAKAKYYAYQWAEANKDMSIRSSGPDFKFLMGASLKEHMELMRSYRRSDREAVDNWFSIRRNSLYGKVSAYYSSTTASAYPGGGFGGGY